MVDIEGIIVYFGLITICYFGLIWLNLGSIDHIITQSSDL